VSLSALERLRRALAAALLRSGLDTSDDILILAAFLHDFRWSGRGLSAREIAREWEALLAAPPAGHFHELYLHFPYCGEKCLFCLFTSRVPPGRAAITSFLARARAEIDYYARAFRGAEFRTFAAGGGTPSLLSAAELESFYAPVFAGFGLEDDAFVSIECSPATVDAEKLRVLRRLGFSRVSFGVQSLDPAVLRSVRRGGQTAGMVADAARGAREAGFEDVNLDLLFGLLGDTNESFLESFRGVARLRPTTIQVCGLSVTDGYLRANKTTRAEFARHYGEALPAALDGLKREAAAAGYRPDGLSPEKGVWAFVAEETPRALYEKWLRKEPHDSAPSSLLGLGDGSRSHVFGRAHYKREGGAFAPEAPLYRLAPVTRKEEMALYLFYVFERRGEVRLRRFRDHFGTELEDSLPLELKILAALEALSRVQGGFRFVPQEQSSRIFHGLVLLLDTLRDSGPAAGRLDGALLEEVRRELEVLHV
jgi:coproporphyrinogen III oxidase-like Fe-S oxidoreductase